MGAGLSINREPFLSRFTDNVQGWSGAEMLEIKRTAG
jgi:hypothetical protein